MVKAEVSTFQSGVDVKSASPVVQTITRPEDIGQWRWNVVARNNGVLALTIAVTTLRTDSDVALVPTKFFDIAIKVDESFGHKAGSVLDSTWVKVGGLGGLGAIGAAVVAYLVYRRSRPEDAAATAAGATPAPAQNQSIVQAQTPRPAVPPAPGGKKSRKRR